VVPGEVVEGEGVDLVEAAEDAELDLALAELGLQLRGEAEDGQFLPPVHEDVADADLLFPPLLGLPVDPPHYLHVEGADLALLAGSAVGELDGEVVAGRPRGLQQPVEVEELEVLGLLVLDGGHVLQLPAELGVDLRVDLLVLDGRPQRLAQPLHVGGLPRLHDQLEDHLLVDVAVADGAVQHFVEDLLVEALELIGGESVDVLEVERQEGDAGVEQRVPALRPVLLILELAMRFLQEYHAVSNADRGSDDIVDKSLLESVHP
jgi:hypothetical protein